MEQGTRVVVAVNRPVHVAVEAVGWMTLAWVGCAAVERRVRRALLRRAAREHLMQMCLRVAEVAALEEMWERS